MKTNYEMISFHEAFWGEYENFVLLENELLKKETLPIWQYANYLSRIAFCIELGMKTIINIDDTFDYIHYLDELYNKMPNVFREMVEKKSGWNKNAIDELIRKIKNIFVEFRYMNKDNLLLFIEEYDFNDNMNIVFPEVLKNENYVFIDNLLHEIINYYYYQNKNINKELFYGKNIETDYNEMLSIYFKEIERIQSLSYVWENDGR